MKRFVLMLLMCDSHQQEFIADLNSRSHLKLTGKASIQKFLRFHSTFEN